MLESIIEKLKGEKMKYSEFLKGMWEMHNIYEQISDADLAENSNEIIEQIAAEICGLTKLKIK